MSPSTQRLPVHPPDWGVNGQFTEWENASCEPRQASAPILAMDRRTWQALTAGYVELPRRSIHSDLWFRLLRTMLDELNTPISLSGYYGETIRCVWERSGHPFRAGQRLWHPYEILAAPVQLQILEAAATIIELIESDILSPEGEFAGLFVAEPQSKFTNSLQADAGEEESVSCGLKAVEAIKEIVIEARHNPEAARTLFLLASYGRRDPASLEEHRELRAIFSEV